MNKIKFFVFLFLSLSFPLISQTIYIGVGTGLNFINGANYYTADFGRIGRYENVNGTVTNFPGLGLSDELEFQLNGKYSLDNSPFSFTAGFNYFRMRGNESMPIYDNILERDIIKDVTSKMDIWSFQLGANYSFNLYSVRPFVAFSFLSNYLDDVYIEIAHGEYISQFPSYKNGMRYGYSLGAGMGYNIFSNFELELSTNYNSLNVLHKRDGEALLNSVNVLFNIYYKII